MKRLGVTLAVVKRRRMRSQTCFIRKRDVVGVRRRHRFFCNTQNIARRHCLIRGAAQAAARCGWVVILHDSQQHHQLAAVIRRVAKQCTSPGRVPQHAAEQVYHWRQRLHILLRRAEQRGGVVQQRVKRGGQARCT